MQRKIGEAIRTEAAILGFAAIVLSVMVPFSLKTKLIASGVGVALFALCLVFPQKPVSAPQS